MAPGECTATAGLACEGSTASSLYDKTSHTRMGKELGTDVNAFKCGSKDQARRYDDLVPRNAGRC